MHINAMGAGGIGEFDKYWRAFRSKDGIIIDVRRNGGGWTEYFLIDKLERVMTSQNVLRGMVPFRYPGTAGNGNYVVLSNENNGSDGEAFVEHFKARKLGTVVGVPSWGGLVGILNQQLTIDNGTVEQSNNSFYGRDGKWIVENHGADPDILVDNDPGSAVAGRDLQLEKAIEVMLEKIKKNPAGLSRPSPLLPQEVGRSRGTASRRSLRVIPGSGRGQRISSKRAVKWRRNAAPRRCAARGRRLCDGRSRPGRRPHNPGGPGIDAAGNGQPDHLQPREDGLPGPGILMAEHDPADLDGAHPGLPVEGHGQGPGGELLPRDMRQQPVGQEIDGVAAGGLEDGHARPRRAGRRGRRPGRRGSAR